MANTEFKRVLHLSPEQHLRQNRLFSLISVLCAPRNQQPRADVYHVIVASDLAWDVDKIDSNSSWLYLTEPARVHRVADCLVFTKD
jgi:hypothetical protein